MILLFDLAPVSSGVGMFLAAAFFLILAATAFVAFKLLKRTVKMAVRIGLVVVIMAVAVAGSVALWAFSRPVQRDRPFPTLNR